MYNKLNEVIFKFLPKEYNEEKEQEFLNIVIFAIDKACIIDPKYFD